MSLANVVVSLLLAVAVLLCFVCAVGALVMRDPLQKLHFLSPPASLAAFLFVAAVLVYDHHDWQAAMKTLLVAVLLTLINAVVTHATARAALHHMAAKRLKQVPDRIPLVDADGEPIGDAGLGPPGGRPEDVSPWT